MYKSDYLILFVLVFSLLHSCKDKQTGSLLSKDTTPSSELKVVGYDYGKNEIVINNWLLEKSVKDYNDIIDNLGLKPDSIVESTSNFEEHGYHYYKCYYKNNVVGISGESEFNDTYYVHSFNINSTILNINGITVGSSKEAVLKEFSKHNISDNEIHVYLEDQLILFYINNGTVVTIEFLTPA